MVCAKLSAPDLGPDQLITVQTVRTRRSHNRDPEHSGSADHQPSHSKRIFNASLGMSTHLCAAEHRVSCGATRAYIQLRAGSETL
jgi:hypothetical protein